MLKTVFEKLDLWMIEKNEECRREESILLLNKCDIKVIGQTALIEAQVNLSLRATVDVDVFANYQYSVEKKFKDLLKEAGKELDPVGHEAWMPIETEYSIFYEGDWVTAYLAKPEYIILSKAMKAPEKNKNLILEYIASVPPGHFFKLAKKYKVNLDIFVE